MGLFDFFTGTPAKYEQVSNLTPSQLRQQKQLQAAGRGRGAGGAFGESSDYWRDILSNNPQAFSAFEAPEQRRFNEQIIPDLAEQFAGMGSGNLSSSGFRNAVVGAGTDLSERLASMRAGLRENAASNLFNLGQSALTPHTQYQQTSPGTQGFLSQAAPAIGSAVSTAFGGPLAGGLSALSNSLFGGNNRGGTGQFGQADPYGNQSGSFSSSNLPNFSFR